jgi:hypothetical protein
LNKPVSFTIENPIYRHKKEMRMSIQPESEELRKAVRWVSEERRYSPEKPLKTLIEAACLKFDLSPTDADFLDRFVKEKL